MSLSFSPPRLSWSLGLPDPFMSSGQLDPSRSSAQPNTSWSSGPPHPYGLSDLIDLFGSSSPPNPYFCWATPVCLGHRVRSLRLGRQARLGSRACPTRFCRQASPIRLNRMTILTYHGCWACRVRLGLSQECEVE